MTNHDEFSLPDELQQLCNSLAVLKPVSSDQQMHEMLFAAGRAVGAGKNNLHSESKHSVVRSNGMVTYFAGVGSGLLSAAVMGIVFFNTNRSDSQERIAVQPEPGLQQDRRGRSEVAVDSQNQIQSTKNDVSIESLGTPILSADDLDTRGLSPVMRQLVNHQLTFIDKPRGSNSSNSTDAEPTLLKSPRLSPLFEEFL